MSGPSQKTTRVVGERPKAPPRKRPVTRVLNELTRLRGRPRAITVGGVSYPSISTALRLIDRTRLDPRLLAHTIKSAVQIVWARIKRGWDEDQAFGLTPPPPRAILGYPRQVTFQGKVYGSLTELGGAVGVRMPILRQRMVRDRWSVDAAANQVPPPNNRLVSRSTVGLIYLIRSRTTNRGYVGLTVDLKRRMANHLAAAFKKVPKPGTLHQAIKSEGCDAFEVHILESDVSADRLHARERHWITSLQTMLPAGFNENGGGVFAGFGERLQIGKRKFNGIADAARHYNIPLSRVYHRLQCGWTVPEALEVVRPSYGGGSVSIVVGTETHVFGSRRRAAAFFHVPARLITEQAIESDRSWADELSYELAQRAKQNFKTFCRQRGPKHQGLTIFGPRSLASTIGNTSVPRLVKMGVSPHAAE